MQFALRTRKQRIILCGTSYSRTEGIEIARSLESCASLSLETGDMVDVRGFWPDIRPLDAEAAFLLAGQLFDAACKLGRARAEAMRLSGRAMRGQRARFALAPEAETPPGFARAFFEANP